MPLMQAVAQVAAIPAHLNQLQPCCWTAIL
jgi:hypothetical protein